MRMFLATLKPLSMKKEILIGYTFIIVLSLIQEKFLFTGKIRTRIAAIVFVNTMPFIPHVGNYLIHYSGIKYSCV